MMIGEWLQINNKHKIFYNGDIVHVLFEIDFKHFWISLLKDKFGYEFYFGIFKLNIWLAQNKKKRRLSCYGRF